MTTTPDLSAVKGRQQQMWSAGDFSKVATPLVIVGECLCESVDVSAGQRVLDVACGSGTAALAAARRNCVVTGVDYVPALLARGRERATVEGLEVDFRDGDAEQLPFPDASFDVVLSTFGVMFAPNQEQAASELLRVCRPGGTIGLANWTPEGRVGEMFRLTAKYLPPPPGLKPPARWGTEQGLRELFGTGLADLRIERRHFVSRYRDAEEWLTFFRTYFGPVVTAFATLDTAGQQAFATEMTALMNAQNEAADGTLKVRNEYLEAVVTRAG
ncbi:MAG: Methyltransferase type 11 [uncultured Thermomicrobiales bacterium]|uniref:Methyltransferase type 11 n=1 Tax=uncultured Thermomicrobiales bacterium TaxID=1645740 RepID=A0A6J4UMR4_9BACT|nr:MAG: Methyltransferase type 11 [uncultured Thermomicrobiales bacterium]